MDQLKEHLVKIKPYAFWIACTVVLLGSLGTWYMTTGTMSTETTERTNKAKGAFSTLTGIKNKAADHPNEETAKGMRALNKAYGEEIAKGWALQYQKQEGVLVWPASFDRDFHDAVRPLRPIESVPFPTLNPPISDTFRRRYRDFIEDELPTLATMIGGRWQVSRDPAGAAFNPNPTGPIGPDGRPVGEVDRSMVLWSPANQKEILDFHFGFTVRNTAPETLEVLYAQEDLWVLQNVMGIIKATNQGYEGRHDAAIKQIHFVRIGLSALGYAGQVQPVMATDPNAVGGSGGEGQRSPYGPGGPGPGGPGMQPGQPPQPGQPNPNPANPNAAAAPTDPRQDVNFNPKDPANWRYVDAKNMPLAGSQLRTALATQTPTEQDALLTVAKRVPVRMYLEIDQRRLSKLLAEMGNAPLPVEVRQLRINRSPAPPGTVDALLTAGGGQSVPGGEGRYSAQPSMPQRGGYGEGMAMLPQGPNGLSVTRDATLDTNLIQLEIYGIVYLYNPVIPGVLGLPPTGSPTAMVSPPATVGAGG